MSKHTPGPWELQAGRSFKTQSGEFHLAYGADKHGNPNFRGFCELDANAHLIAAAPELLAALDAVDLNLSEWKPEKLKDYGLDWILEQARAAIAKAIRP